jgi:hypothetical protein
MDGREPRGIRVGDCVVPIDGSAKCCGREVQVVYLDGYYVVGDWLCEEVSGLCVELPGLRVALKKLERGVGVVKAEVFY